MMLSIGKEEYTRPGTSSSLLVYYYYYNHHLHQRSTTLAGVNFYFILFYSILPLDITFFKLKTQIFFNQKKKNPNILLIFFYI